MTPKFLRDEDPGGSVERGGASFERGGSAATVRGTAGLYALLVESVRDYAIFALDPDGFVLSWNAGAERLKQYTAEEIIGQHFSVFYPEAAKESGFPDYELKMAAAEGRFEDEGWRIRKDGSRFWANVVITALRGETGELVGYAKVTRDLTERREAELRALEDERMLAEARAVNETRTGFLAAMSHELRTPLNAIGGYADLMAIGIGGTLSEQHREYLRRIQGSQQHLLGIINDLLNYSRIEAGQVTYDVSPVPVHVVVDGVIAMVEPQAKAKGLTLAHGPCSEEAVALADRLKVEQIVLNLLSNAVKFTPEGGRVTVECARGAEQVSIVVSDTGPGIAPELHEAIFDPFVQVGRTLTSTSEGTGLGLAISRDLARAMDGDVTVESTPEQGAKFRLSLKPA
ncbi:MAG: sensor protein [Gemmatimonadetes bacterium]|nr:sensor protein [Gemmatimonadota bacterium]